VEWIKTSHNFRFTEKNRLEVKRWPKLCYAKRNQKRAGLSTLVSYKINFKTKIATRDKESYFIMIKESTYQENRTIIKHAFKTEIKIHEAKSNTTAWRNR
jgi:hypothetical protein